MSGRASAEMEMWLFSILIGKTSSFFAGSIPAPRSTSSATRLSYGGQPFHLMAKKSPSAAPSITVSGGYGSWQPVQAQRRSRSSRDGKWITYFTWAPAASRIWRIPRLGGTPQPLTPSNEDAAYGDLSPDDRQLVFARTESQIARLAVIPVNGGPEKRLVDSPSTVPRWSP